MLGFPWPGKASGRGGPASAFQGRGTPTSLPDQLWTQSLSDPEPSQPWPSPLGTMADPGPHPRTWPLDTSDRTQLLEPNQGSSYFPERS